MINDTGILELVAAQRPDDDLVIPALLTDILPRWASLAELRLGDLVKFGKLPQPVTITGSEREDVHQIFSWMYVDRDGTLVEGRGVHDVEQVLLIARAEEIPAAEVHKGNVLLEPKHASPYQLVAEDVFTARPGLLGIAWRAGELPSGSPHIIGGLQRYPSETVLRAPRGWTR